MSAEVFSFNTELVVRRVDSIRMSACDLRFGIEHGYLTRKEASHFARRELANGSDDQGLLRIADDVDWAESTIGMEPLETRHASRDKWLFIWLDTVYRHREQLRDPLRVVEMIYAEFDYPPDVAPFVRYMPLQPGDIPGENAILTRWRSYLDLKRSLYEG